MALSITQQVHDYLLPKVKKAADMCLAEADRLVPVDTGHLQASLKVDIVDNKSSFEVDLNSDVDYAVHQEYGTYKMAAQPFFRPAIAKLTGYLQAMVK